VQLHWLAWAYQLEFEGKAVYLQLWVSLRSSASSTRIHDLSCKPVLCDNPKWVFLCGHDFDLAHEALDDLQIRETAQDSKAGLCLGQEEASNIPASSVPPNLVSQTSSIIVIKLGFKRNCKRV
jgi:hypothetical protein